PSKNARRISGTSLKCETLRTSLKRSNARLLSSATSSTPLDRGDYLIRLALHEPRQHGGGSGPDSELPSRFSNDHHSANKTHFVEAKKRSRTGYETKRPSNGPSAGEFAGHRFRSGGAASYRPPGRDVFGRQSPNGVSLG